MQAVAYRVEISNGDIELELCRILGLTSPPILIRHAVKMP